MRLQQLRYAIEVADCGSITAAAEKLFIAQPSLSKAVSELEREMGVTIFSRSARGVRPTEEGMRFLSYARQVVEQADLLENAYLHSTPLRRVFAVSSQHYAFVVNAFVELVREIGQEKYEFSLREGTTQGIIDDVRIQRSELGVIYQSNFNREVIGAALKHSEAQIRAAFHGFAACFREPQQPACGARQRDACRSRAVSAPNLRPRRPEFVLFLRRAPCGCSPPTSKSW